MLDCGVDCCASAGVASANDKSRKCDDMKSFAAIEILRLGADQTGFLAGRPRYNNCYTYLYFFAT